MGGKRLESPTALGARALAWGTLISVSGVGLLCFAVYKLTGAKNVSLNVFHQPLFLSVLFLFNCKCLRLNKIWFLRKDMDVNEHERDYPALHSYAS